MGVVEASLTGQEDKYRGYSSNFTTSISSVHAVFKQDTTDSTFSQQYVTYVFGYVDIANCNNSNDEQIKYFE